jgi:hypothetical protein
MCYKYINIHIKCNVSSTCNILNLSCVEEYVGRLGQLFCFPRKIVEFPIHFCLVYLKNSYLCIKVKKSIFFVRVRVFGPRRSRDLKTGEDKRPFLVEVHIKFFRRSHELQNKRHHWKNYKFILYLPLSN